MTEPQVRKRWQLGKASRESEERIGLPFLFITPTHSLTQTLGHMLDLLAYIKFQCYFLFSHYEKCLVIKRIKLYEVKSVHRAAKKLL